MQERDQDLIDEQRAEKSGYFDYLSENLNELKAEYLTQFSVTELIDFFFYNELTIDAFFDEHEFEFGTYCSDSFESHQDWEATKNELNRRINQ